MPELPEVETVRRGLERHLVGRRITAVEVGRERTVRRTSREALIVGLTDTVVEAADRRGKYLLLPLDSGDTHDDPPAHEWPGVARRRRCRAAASHACRHASRRRPRGVVRRPPDVRRGRGVRPRQRARSSCPSWPAWASIRSPSRFDPAILRGRVRHVDGGRSSRCCSTSTWSRASATSTPTRSCIGPGFAPTEPASTLDRRRLRDPARVDRRRAERGDRRRAAPRSATRSTST